MDDYPKYHSNNYLNECLLDPKKHRLHFDQVKVGAYTLNHCHQLHLVMLSLDSYNLPQNQQHYQN